MSTNRKPRNEREKRAYKAGYEEGWQHGVLDGISAKRVPMKPKPTKKGKAR